MIRWARLAGVFCALALLSAGVLPARAGQDVPPPLQVDAQIGGQTGAVALDGSHLYLAIGSRVDVLDVSQPGQPVVVGASAPLSASVDSLTIANGYAYLADGTAGLHILDVHDPRRPTEVAAVDLGGAVVRVVVVDSLAYVAASAAGLHLLDVSDPTSPQEVGSYNAAYGVLDVAVVGSTAYAAVDEGAISRGTRIALPRLRTLDVSDPTNPVELGIADVSAGSGVVASLMLADGSRVDQYWNRYGASGCDSGGIHVLDVSDPTAPTNTADLPGACYGDAMAGTSALFAVGSQLTDSILLYRPGTATAPTEIHPGLLVSGLALANSLLYAAGTDQSTSQAMVRVLDLSGAGQPRVVGTYSETTLSHAQGTAVGPRAFLADGHRLSVVDLSRPDKPVEIGAANLPPSTGVTSTWAADVAVLGSDAYVTNGQGVLTYSVADPTHPTLLGRQDLGTATPGLGHQGTFLYVIVGSLPPAGQFGLQYRLVVLDLADPAHPQPKGEWSAVGGLWNGLLVSGTHAYLTAGRSLVVLDLSDPLHPQQVGAAPFSDTGGERLAMIGSTVFVAGFSGISAYDVSDPSQPQPLATFGGDGGLVSSLAADGSRLDAAYWSGGGVRVFDVTDPTAPTLLGADPSMPNGEVAASIIAANGHLLSSTYSGLWVLHLPD